MEESLYPFFDDTDKPHMAAAWKNVHYTELAGSIVFDTLSDTLLVGCEEEHLSRVRVYAWAVGAHHKIKLEGLGSHNPVYTYNESGRVQSITLRAREYAADSLPRIVELGNMVDDTGMMTVYVVRVGIEPVLAVEAPADILEEALLPNLKGLSIPRARILEAPVVFRAAELDAFLFQGVLLFVDEFELTKESCFSVHNSWGQDEPELPAPVVVLPGGDDFIQEFGEIHLSGVQGEKFTVL